MAINKKLIHFNSKSSFETELANNNLLDTSIVFIKETKEIWTHGQLYDCSGGLSVDLTDYLTTEDLEKINSAISSLQTSTSDLENSKLGKDEAEDTYAKKTDIPSLSGYLTETAANNKYATVTTAEGLQEKINKLETDVANKADDSALANYATNSSVDTKIAGLVDSAPEALNTLNELAAALGNDHNFATTIATQIGNKADQTALDTTNASLSSLTETVNNNSVSKEGETLTVRINGTTQSLTNTNTWRSISDSVSSTSSDVSASSKAVKTAYDTAVAAQSAANTAQATANNKWTYSESTIKGVKVNNAGNADTVGGFTVGCNVPANAKFTDNDTHYTTGINAGATGATSNSAQTNPYVTVKDDSTYRSQIRLIGDGATTVKSDASGNITISSTDTNTHPDLSSYATQSWVTNKGYITGITKSMVTTALGYTPPATDTNTTYSAGSGISLSGTQFSHADTSSLSGSYGPTANVTGSNGATIVVPQITVDGYGHVTGITNRTYTSVDTNTDTNTDTKNTAGSTNSTSTLYLIGATSQAANPQTYSNSGLYATNASMYATAYYETSDEKLKNFRHDVEIDFEKLKSIPKKYFTWKEGDATIQIGTSAQAVQKVYPELVSGDEKLHVDYARLVIPALAAIDKLHEENQVLKDRLTKLEEVVYGN